MNRRDRRAQAAKGKKFAADATDDEIFPGSHGPVQPQVQPLMQVALEELGALLPGYDFTLFAAQKPAEGGPFPRFNYMSTASRDDMFAVLRAFLAKNSGIAEKLDRIKDAPPSGARN